MQESSDEVAMAIADTLGTQKAATRADSRTSYELAILAGRYFGNARRSIWTITPCTELLHSKCSTVCAAGSDLNPGLFGPKVIKSAGKVDVWSKTEV